jgi:hypothetical protein
MICRAPYCVEEVTDVWAVCDTCWDFRHELLSAMPWLWLRVHSALAPTGRTALRERVTTSEAGSSIPLRTGPLYALEYALSLAEMWADTFLRRGCPGRLPERGRAREAHIFSRAVAICRRYDHELRHSPLAGDYYCDIHRGYWTLARVDNSRADTVRLPLPCPACDRMTLIERNAGEYAQCLTCGREWSQAALAKEARNGR